MPASRGHLFIVRTRVLPFSQPDTYPHVKMCENVTAFDPVPPAGTSRAYGVFGATLVVILVRLVSQ